MADSAAFCPSCGKSTAPSGAGATGTAAAPAPSTTASGLNDNIAGLLAYLFIPAIVFLVVEPYNRNKFIRFHSFQSIFYGIATFIIHMIAWMIPILNLVLGPIVGIAILIGWVVLMVKAYQGTMFKLPIIGDLAEKQANQ